MNKATTVMATWHDNDSSDVETFESDSMFDCFSWAQDKINSGYKSVMFTVPDKSKPSFIRDGKEVLPVVIKFCLAKGVGMYSEIENKKPYLRLVSASSLGIKEFYY